MSRWRSVRSTRAAGHAVCVGAGDIGNGNRGIDRSWSGRLGTGHGPMVSRWVYVSR